MDFNTKPINGPSSSLVRSNGAKGTTRLGRAKFKSNSSTSVNTASQEAAPLQTFAVTALDTALLDLSRQQTPFEKAAYGHELLNQLERLKIGILSGSISKQDLLNLNQCITDEKSETDDPKLKAILKEIETRVAVELAKFGL